KVTFPANSSAAAIDTAPSSYIVATHLKGRTLVSTRFIVALAHVVFQALSLGRTNMKTTIVLPLVAIYLVWIPYVHSASFDCAKAKTKIEKQICSNTKLSELDDKLTTLYNKVLAQSPVPEDTKEQQREWVKGSRNVCKDAAGL